MLVDFAGLSVLPQQPPEHTLSPHPEHLGRHPGLVRTLSLSDTGVPALALSGEELEGAGAGVDICLLGKDVTVLEELLDVGAGVGIADLGLLVGVEPDFALADASDGGGEPLLRAKVDHRAAEVKGQPREMDGQGDGERTGSLEGMRSSMGQTSSS